MRIAVFDGIGDQVGQGAREQVAVAAHHAGLFRHGQADIDPALVGQGADREADFFDQGCQAEFAVVGAERAAFEAGQFEHRVERGAHGLRRALRRIDQFLALGHVAAREGVARGFEQVADGLHGLAQVVRGVGDEFGFFQAVLVRLPARFFLFADDDEGRDDHQDGRQDGHGALQVLVFEFVALDRVLLFQQVDLALPLAGVDPGLHLRHGLVAVGLKNLFRQRALLLQRFHGALVLPRLVVGRRQLAVGLFQVRQVIGLSQPVETALDLRLPRLEHAHADVAQAQVGVRAEYRFADLHFLRHREGCLRVVGALHKFFLPARHVGEVAERKHFRLHVARPARGLQRLFEGLFRVFQFARQRVGNAAVDDKVVYQLGHVDAFRQGYGLVAVFQGPFAVLEAGIDLACGVERLSPHSEDFLVRSLEGIEACQLVFEGGAEISLFKVNSGGGIVRARDDVVLGRLGGQRNRFLDCLPGLIEFSFEEHDQGFEPECLRHGLIVVKAVAVFLELADLGFGGIVLSEFYEKGDQFGSEIALVFRRRFLHDLRFHFAHPAHGFSGIGLCQLLDFPGLMQLARQKKICLSRRCWMGACHGNRAQNEKDTACRKFHR